MQEYVEFLLQIWLFSVMKLYFKQMMTIPRATELIQAIVSYRRN